MPGFDRSLALPRDWPRGIRSAAVHAVSLSEFALTAALGWASTSTQGMSDGQKRVGSFTSLGGLSVEPRPQKTAAQSREHECVPDAMGLSCPQGRLLGGAAVSLRAGGVRQPQCTAGLASLAALAMSAATAIGCDT